MRNVAIVRNSEAARSEIGKKRLHVPKRSFARRCITHVTARYATWQTIDDVVPIEIPRNMAHGPMGMKVAAIPAGNACCLLTAVLERMQTERDDG